MGIIVQNTTEPEWVTSTFRFGGFGYWKNNNMPFSLYLCKRGITLSSFMTYKAS